MKNRTEQWIDWHTSRYYKEVYWLNWPEPECGRAWEETMFGCHIAPINNRVDGSHGVGISDWPCRGTQNDPERRVWNTISMRYIEHLFQMSTWQRSFNLQNWRIFNIPRDGATSLYINSFTTMLGSEEQRVAREERAEAIALANAQPAQKKRLKATGRMEEQRPKDEKVIEEAVTELEQLPESPKRQIPSSDGKRRASSPSVLPSQRLILAPHTRRPSSGSNQISAIPKSQPVLLQQTAQAPQMSIAMRSDAEIYPKHIESKTNEVQQEPTSEIVKRIKRRPKGLMDAYRQRKRTESAKKEAEAKKKRDLNDKKTRELQQNLIRETELKVPQPAATNEAEIVKATANTEKEQALINKAEVEARERQKRKNRII